MLNAAPHMNGNTPETFREVGRELHMSALTLQSDLASARAAILHGRNYQHLPAAEADEARDKDIRRIDSYITAAIAAQQFAIEAFKKGA